MSIIDLVLYSEILSFLEMFELEVGAFTASRSLIVEIIGLSALSTSSSNEPELRPLD